MFVPTLENFHQSPSWNEGCGFDASDTEIPRLAFCLFNDMGGWMWKIEAHPRHMKSELVAQGMGSDLADVHTQLCKFWGTHRDRVLPLWGDQIK